MGANFLRTLDWMEDDELSKTIVSFYTKANAWKHLMNFYESKAQLEIDEYRSVSRHFSPAILAQRLRERARGSDCRQICCPAI